MDQLKKCTVVGGGAMGRQIALNSAIYAYQVAVCEPVEAVRQDLRAWEASYLAGRIAKGRMTEEDIFGIKSRFLVTENLEDACRDADIVIEAIIEQEDAKRDVLGKISQMVRPDTLIATNSSFMVSSLFKDDVVHPERLANLHYFMPALVMKLVEVVRGEHTSQETIDRLMAFGRSAVSYTHLDVYKRQYLRNARHGIGTRDMVFKDNIMEGSAGNSPEELFGDLPMGLTAENVAEQYHIEREIQDLFAYRSQQRAQRAIAEGRFKEQIVPVGNFDTDEFPRETTLEKLASLKSVFKKGGCVTAGNSSGRNDGASAVIVMSREKADALGYDYYLRHVSSAVVGIHPSIMGIGPIGASKEALEKAGLTIDEIGLIELNEAFASQSVAVMREWASWSGKETFDSIWERTNVNGSGISLGHPLAATGGILTTKLFYELKKRRCV